MVFYLPKYYLDFVFINLYFVKYYLDSKLRKLRIHFNVSVNLKTSTSKLGSVLSHNISYVFFLRENAVLILCGSLISIKQDSL